MFANRNTVFYTNVSEIDKRVSLEHRGYGFKSCEGVKPFVAGDIFHVLPELVLTEPDDVLMFEGMIIQRVTYHRDLITLEFNGEEWMLRRKDSSLKKYIQYRKKESTLLLGERNPFINYLKK